MKASRHILLSRQERIACPGVPILFRRNVRELENILERAITLTTEARDQPRNRTWLQLSPQCVGAGAAGASAAAPLGDHLEDIERDAIVKALEQSRYNKTAAAKALRHMSFRALRYRIKKLGIE